MTVPRASRGVTLVEILIAMSLLVLVTGMMLLLLLPSFSLFRKQSGQSDAYRNCMQTVNRFRQEILSAQVETVTIAPDLAAISWQKGRDDPPFSGTTGEPLMDNRFWVLFYQVEERRVLLKQVEGVAPGSNKAAQLSLQALSEARSADGEWRVLARDISSFQIADNDGDPTLLEPPFHLSLECTIDTKGRETNDQESFAMNAIVSPRGQRW